MPVSLRAAPLRGERPMTAARRARIGAGLVARPGRVRSRSHADSPRRLSDRAADRGLRAGHPRGRDARDRDCQRGRRRASSRSSSTATRRHRHGQLRRPRALRLLRRHLVPPGPRRLRHPGRRPQHEDTTRDFPGPGSGGAGLRVRDRAAGGRASTTTRTWSPWRTTRPDERQPVLRRPRRPGRPAASSLLHDLRPGRDRDRCDRRRSRQCR